MKIITAQHSGFCYGVKRAVSLAEGCIGTAEEIHTLGPIIHNPQMVSRLAAAGIKTAAALDEVSPGSTVIIRSHGVGPAVYEAADAKGLNVIDATCPHVKKAQQTAHALLEEGFSVVVVGEKHHPEVKSIIEWAQHNALVIETLEEARQVPELARIGVVAQTTFAGELFHEITEVLRGKTQDLKIYRTICTATDLRQEAALKTSAAADVMIVVGGKNSANTTRLAQLCQDAGCRVYHIETAAELNAADFAGIDTVGITAGASTPDWIIEEVYHKMQEFDQMLNNTAMTLEKDTVVKGKIVGVRADEVFVDIGYKAEGIITLAELSYPTAAAAGDVVKEGDIIDVYVLNADSHEGAVLLSKIKADQIVAWDKLEAAISSGDTLEAVVTEAVKGGLRVAVLGISGFIPASMVDLQFVEDLQPFVGQTLQVRPLEMDRAKKRVVLSRRVLLEEERARQEEAVFAKIEPGQILKGTVRRLADYGAFVDIGGIDGLVHISDLAWHRVKTPAEVVQVGDEVTVFVLKADPKTKRISLSLKQVEKDPWLTAVEDFQVNMTVKAKITKIASFGAFAELAPGLEGLIHVSELSAQKVAKVEDAVRIGQEVTVKILEVNKDTKRIALSMSQAVEDAERLEYRDYLNKQESFGLTLGDKFAHLFKDRS